MSTPAETPRRRATVSEYLRMEFASLGRRLFTPHEGLETVAKVHCLQVDLPLAEVYAGWSFRQRRAARSGWIRATTQRQQTVEET